ncbi:MAG: EFR1 family ferrodoxin [Oscillospiraceae bacterium]|nr:EFR1 family ferrodoxin [Oscillospiraceae bacterium]
MIFYFSGTGNSYQAASILRGKEEPLFDMADCLWRGETDFALAEGEALGIVCPVYYGGLPSVVREFVRRLTLDRTPDYCYAVLTCGGKPYGAAAMLENDLRARGIGLNAAFPVVMPDNYVLMFQIPEEKEQDRILSEAEARLRRIKVYAAYRRSMGLPIPARDTLATRAMYPAYEYGRRTKKFYSDDQCVSCGICVSRCPARAMVMENGRPKWVADRCIHCMACVRCGAVQYGKSTVGKKRYTNPILKVKQQKHHHH